MLDKISDKSFIKVYDDLIRPEDCDVAVEFFKEENKFQKTFTRVQAEGASFTFKSDTSAEINGDNYKDVFAKGPKLKSLFVNLNNALRVYTSETKILEHVACPEIHWEPSKIQRTLPGGGYHVWHVEKSGTSLDQLKRVLAYTLYLNDVEEGGETEFLIQNMRVKPKKGRVCFFPAHFPYLHRGNPPLSEEKYIMTSWFTMAKID